MKVKDYVRTKDYQNIRSRIGKIIRQDGKYYYLDIDEDTQMVWEKDTILKSSPNIIDLIEVGDYVNGLKVQGVNNEIKGFGTIIFSKDSSIMEDYIYSIVTKEMFSSIEYEVKQ